MRGMLISQIWGKGCPYGGLVVDISGVGQGVSDLLQAVYTKP